MKKARTRKGPAKGAEKRFAVSHLSSSKFAKRGLRGYFEYRDLGIKRATRGDTITHVIRARPGKASHGDWHYHDCDMQFVYVVKGWVRMEYEGIGKILMKAGSCFYQPPRIRHRELQHSKDLEMIEIVAPAKFRTFDSPPPAARKSPARRSRA